MGLRRWWNSLFTDRGKALSLYRRGMGRANEHDHDGAIRDYTAAIEMQAVPPDVKAMTLYNRALAYAAAGDDAKASGDLQAVLALAEAPADVKTACRQKLERMRRRSERNISSSRSVLGSDG
jgi:tetratricopeptide (TPR) repeat protein